jgi:hypothetical protein
MSQGLIMKVLTSWEEIQLLAKSEVAAGNICSSYKQQLVTMNIITMYNFTWHNANVRLITLKNISNH